MSADVTAAVDDDAPMQTEAGQTQVPNSLQLTEPLYKSMTSSYLQYYASH